MDSKYAETAIKAVGYINAGLSAEQSWEKASCEIFIKGSTSQKKSCPKNAFIGLFENNPRVVESKNAVYAKKALLILQRNPNQKYSKSELWSLVIDGPKAHNSQMDVVLGLWNKGLIK
jgi:hypothetical protein